MDMVRFQFTVLFEEPFWVGIYERESKKQYEVCKITFRAEPKDYEVYSFILENWRKLKFSTSIKAEIKTEKCVNPKRMQRLINKQMKHTGIGTKAQQALKLQQEQGKLEHKSFVREQREIQKQYQFALRQKKHKEKHRGH